MKMANMDAILKGLFSGAAPQNVSIYFLYLVVLCRMAVACWPEDSLQAMNEAFYSE